MAFLVASAFFAVFAFAAVIHMTTLSFAAAIHRFYPSLWQQHASPGWMGFRSSPWAVVRFIRSDPYATHVTEPRVLALGQRLVVLQRIQFLLLTALFAGAVILFAFKH